MYSGTPCDECGGPTLLLDRGSIFCTAEDAHPGGHFVKRVAFERSPLKDASRLERKPNFRDRLVQSKPVHAFTGKPIKAPKPEPTPAFSGGMDDYVRSEEK
jgi:hypothetical protein